MNGINHMVVHFGGVHGDHMGGEGLFEDGAAVELCRHLFSATCLDSVLTKIKDRQKCTAHNTLLGGGVLQAFKNELTH